MKRFAWAGAIALLLTTAPAHADKRFDRLIDQAKNEMLADPAGAERIARQAEAAAAPGGAGRQHDLATAKWIQGEAMLRQDAPDRARPLIDQALALIANNPPTKLHGALLLSRGSLNAGDAKVALALADYLKAHDIFRAVGESRSQAIALITIGQLYLDADDNAGSLKYYDRALEVFHADPGLSQTIYNNRGMALTELQRFPEAQAQYDEALKLAKTIGSPALTAQIYRNIARLKVKEGDLTGAETAIARGLAVVAGTPGTARAQFQAISADVARRRGAIDHARTLIEQAFAGTDLTKTDLGFREAHYTAYEIYRTLGDRPAALAHLQAMKRLDDDIWKLTASTNTALMAARFDSANQEARISKLKADDLARKIAMEHAQARFQRVLFSALAAAALVVLALLGFGLFQSRRARIRLTASNAALGKALAAKTEFLATTSHEIRTPLNGILGMTQVMLADTALDAKAKDRVGVVHAAGLTMRALVDDILDVAKMETGNLTVEALPFDLKALLEDVTRIWAEQARAKGLDFRLELGDCPRGLVGDAGRVRQVVYNLLSNAVKFTATGSVIVAAACAGDRLRLTVTDTGIGIAPDKHSEIFDSFKQADGGTTRQYGGTGLGLAIVKNIATAMEGVVRVDSAAGAGATFTVDLPFVPAELAEPVPVVSTGGLLIVDRNPIARAMLKAVLEPRAGSVCFAATCAEAIEIAARDHVARILVDEATARAGDADPVAAIAALVADVTVPVAVLWPTPDEAVRAALLTAGVGQLIAKPIAGPALASALYSFNTHEPLVTQAA